MDHFLAITKALADENRIRILLALGGHAEVCVCRLIELLELAPSTVSKHLFILRAARLVRGRKEGRWVHYRLNTQNAPAVVAEALRWVQRSVTDDPLARRDRAKLDHILSAESTAACAS